MECIVNECTNSVRARGLCNKHYWDWRKTGFPLALPSRKPRRPVNSSCIIDSCFLPIFGRNMCSKHYTRWQRHGDPEYFLREICTTCGVLYPKINRKQTFQECSSCRDERLNKAPRPFKRQEKNKRAQETRRQRRWQVIEHYGAECKCCGETISEFLVLDHINGGGNQQRKKIGSGSGMYKWIKDNNYPENFQVLCHNCNAAKAYYGECPHQRKN
jgi:hypothetical protein